MHPVVVTKLTHLLNRIQNHYTSFPLSSQYIAPSSLGGLESSFSIVTTFTRLSQDSRFVLVVGEISLYFNRDAISFILPNLNILELPSFPLELLGNHNNAIGCMTWFEDVL